MGMNKGEWSEIYAFFKLLSQDKVAIYDSTLTNKLNSYKLISVYRHDNYTNEIEFIISDNKQTIDFIIQNKNYCWDRIEIENLANSILSKIQNTAGTFSIKQVTDCLTPYHLVLKAPSSSKKDLLLKIVEPCYQTPQKLSYSIKSKLGNLSTLLNASSHTNFKYQITGLPASAISHVNSIETYCKLQDRYQYIIDNKGIFNFIGVTSPQFSHNLKMIDSDIEKILGTILLLSYKLKTKDLIPLVEGLIKENPCKIRQQVEYFYKDRLHRILKAITLGMQPGTLYQPANNINGGLLIVDNDGAIKVIDSIYYPNELQNYLFQNIKLDSPSSTRHKMLELKTENDCIFCNLNLQLRFKK